MSKETSTVAGDASEPLVPAWLCKVVRHIEMARTMAMPHGPIHPLTVMTLIPAIIGVNVIIWLAVLTTPQMVAAYLVINAVMYSIWRTFIDTVDEPDVLSSGSPHQELMPRFLLRSLLFSFATAGIICSARGILMRKARSQYERVLADPRLELVTRLHWLGHTLSGSLSIVDLLEKCPDGWEENERLAFHACRTYLMAEAKDFGRYCQVVERLFINRPALGHPAACTLHPDQKITDELREIADRVREVRDNLVSIGSNVLS